MQSFFIPSLGSQIYAMTGMVTQLNLKADHPGTFYGENTQFNGIGFQNQKFMTVAMTAGNFDQWVNTVKASGIPMDDFAFHVLEDAGTTSDTREKLKVDGVPEGTVYFSSIGDDFFRNIVSKYAPTQIPAKVAGGEKSGETRAMSGTHWWYIFFGKLSSDALPFYSPIATFAASLVIAGAVAVVVVVTWLGKWG